MIIVSIPQQKHAARGAAAGVGADGFTLVTGKRRRRAPVATTNGDALAGALGTSATGLKRRRKKGPMERPDFYRFQVRESKRDRTLPLERNNVANAGVPD